MTYLLEEVRLIQEVTPVSDTVTNGIKTTGTCGNMIYTFASNNTDVGIGMLEMIDLKNGAYKGVKVYTENVDNISEFNYTITVTVRMENYPEKKATFSFMLEILAPKDVIPASVYFKPFLENDVSTQQLEPGQSWSY